MSLETGQVLWLRIRFNNTGEISATRHPYLIVEVNNEYGYCEVAQLDSAKDKMHKVLMSTNKLVLCINPQETVISENGFAQLDNTFRLELSSELEVYKRTNATLTKKRLEDVIKAYRKFHTEHEIDENKNVFLSLEEIQQLNS